MLFAGFTAAYLIRRDRRGLGSRLALPAIVWAANTLLLDRGQRGGRGGAAAARVRVRGSWRGSARPGGHDCLAGQLDRLAWQHGRRRASTSPRHAPTAAFFFMLSRRAWRAHLVGGVAALVYAWARGRGGCASTSAAVYWHVVGIVWLYVLILLTAF